MNLLLIRPMTDIATHVPADVAETAFPDWLTNRAVPFVVVFPRATKTEEGEGERGSPVSCLSSSAPPRHDTLAHH